MIAVLDAWAILAYLQAEPAGGHVAEVLQTHDPLASSVNMGEALYVSTRRVGESRAMALINRMRAVVRTEDPDWQLVREAARLKARGSISYADCFAVATAQRHDAPLYTGDPEIVALSDRVRVVDLRKGSV